MDAYAAELLAENRAGGPSQANRSARERMVHWDSLDGRLALVPGKQLLASLSAWMQEEYGVSVSVLRIARQMRQAEIADELTQVVSAIELNEPL